MEVPALVPFEEMSAAAQFINNTFAQFDEKQL